MSKSQGSGRELVGRVDELARLREALARLRSRRPSSLAVVGEPGIGKTRLLAELSRLSDEAANLTLSGRAAQFERDVPFAVFVDALDGYLASQNPDRFDQLGKEHLTELTRVFPALASLEEGSREGFRDERHRAHYAVRALLDLLGASKPLVLLLDDLQWADEGSLELTSYLLRRPPGHSVFMALAYRPGEASPRLRDALDDALRQGRIGLIELRPLAEDDVRSLFDDDVSSATRSRLIKESGGNPFYLEQLCRSPDSRTRTEALDPPTIVRVEVPRAVAAALAQEVGGLSATGRLLLEGAAVAGDPFTLELAVAAGGIAELKSLEALDELLSHQLVRPTEVPRRFSFRHPIVRKAVYAATGDGWRIGAHTRVRTFLEKEGAPATELAHHVEQTARPADEEAIGTLVEAARLSSPLAPGLSAHWLFAALRLLPADATSRRSDMLVRRATALSASGRLEEGRASLAEAIALMPPETGAKRVHLSALLGALGHLLGHHEQARSQLRAALAGLPDPTSPEAAILLIELAADSIYAADWNGAQISAERALAAARDGGERGLEATAEALLTCAYLGFSRVPEAEEHRKRAAELVEHLSDAELGARPGGPYCLGFAEYFLERYEDGVRHFGRGIDASRSVGRGHFLNHMKVGQAWCLIQLGRSQEATLLADEAIDASQLVGNLQALTWALGVRCWIANALGDTEDAIRFGEQAVDVGAARDESLISATVRGNFALACVEAGDFQRCIDEMKLAGAPDFPAFFGDRRPLWCEALSRAELGLGRREEAERWVSLGEDCAEEVGLPVSLGAIRRARSRLLLIDDRPAEAAELALVAAEAQERRGARIEAARTRILAGQSLAATGDAAQATDQLERAYQELDSCGALRHRDHAARELRRLGRRVPRAGRRGSSAEGVEALSERERQIAELIAEGKTNRDVAAALYISEKTVEKHVSKVFAKLGVSVRAAIGAKLPKE